MDRNIRFGTAKTREILDRLGRCDNKLKIIHIAGTNGKGSTAEFFTQILICAKKQVGTFTSPEVYSYNDQFRMNGVPISSDKLNYYIGCAKATGVSATPFEYETAGAIYAFFNEGAEYAVLECGMGGDGDATNAVLKKELAVISSVSLEHTDYLGKTVREICAHKAGIISNCPSVINAHQSAEAYAFFKEAGLKFADKLTLSGGKKFLYDGEEYELQAEGSLQPYNAGTAIEGAKILGIGADSIKKGIYNARPAGRVEVIKRDKVYVLDGAHNPASFEPLAQYLKQLGGEKTLVFGCLSDKDIDGNLKALSGCADAIIAVECGGERGRTLEETKRACEKYFASVTACESVESALDTAKGTVAVCGSFTLLKRAREYIYGRK